MCPVDGLVREGICYRIERPGDMRRGPALDPAEGRACSGPQRDELRVLDPPTPGQLLDDELRVEQKMDLPCPEIAGEIQRPDDARVLGHVVGLDAEVVGDR